MAREPGFSPAEAHRHFAAQCFNQAWVLLERADRGEEDDEQMIHMAHASLWHWGRSDDCSERNLAVGYWQLARIYAVVGRAGEARRYALRCLAYSRAEGPFYLGYAYEALARAELAAGEGGRARAYLDQARSQAELLGEAEGRAQLDADLATIAV